MLIINIIAVNKSTPEYKSIIAAYHKMIKWQINYIDITYVKKIPPNQIKEFEAALIEKHIRSNAYIIVLDENGLNISSQEFAKIIQREEASTQMIDFVIGGAYGLSKNIISNANFCLSLSKLTFPHQLAKTLLVEQLYRAQTIVTNHPYHK